MTLGPHFNFIDDSMMDFVQSLLKFAMYLDTVNNGGGQVTYTWSYTGKREDDLWMTLTALHHKDVMEAVNIGHLELPPAIDICRDRGTISIPDGIALISGVYHLRDSSRDEKYLISLHMPRGADCVVALTYRPKNDPYRGWNLRAKEAYFLDHASVATHETCNKGTENTVPFFHLYAHGSHSLRCLIASKGFSATPLDDYIYPFLPRATQRRMYMAEPCFESEGSDTNLSDELEEVE